MTFNILLALLISKYNIIEYYFCGFVFLFLTTSLVLLLVAIFRMRRTITSLQNAFPNEAYMVYHACVALVYVIVAYTKIFFELKLIIYLQKTEGGWPDSSTIFTQGTAR